MISILQTILRTAQRVVRTTLTPCNSMLITAAMIITAVVPSASFNALGAQVHFQKPPGDIAYDRYYTIFECDAAIRRVLDSAERAAPIWQDTLPWSESELRQPLPEVVVSVANRCAKLRSRIDWTNSRERETLYEWLQIMLLRGDTAAVADGLRRGLAEQKFQSPTSAILELKKMLELFATFPQRPFPQWDVLDYFMQRQQLSTGDRIRTILAALRAAYRRADWTVLETFAKRGERLIDSLNADEQADTALHIAIVSLMTLGASRELDTTLETGGRTAYVQKLNTILAPLIDRGWIRARETPTMMAKTPDQQAAPIDAVYWYPEPPNQSVPVRGKVSILVFMDILSYYNSHQGGFIEPSGFFYTLRRLKTRFPELDITIVVATSGWFGHASPLSVQDEGLAYKQWLLDARQLPVRLAIDSTPFYRLPGYDRRRVDMKSINRENYSIMPENFLRELSLSVIEMRDNPTAYLIDTNGTIMGRGISRRTEPDVARLIRAMLREQNQPNQQ